MIFPKFCKTVLISISIEHLVKTQQISSLDSTTKVRIKLSDEAVIWRPLLFLCLILIFYRGNVIKKSEKGQTKVKIAVRNVWMVLFFFCDVK